MTVALLRHAAAAALAFFPALAFAADFDGSTLSPWWGLPFAGLLLSIARLCTRSAAKATACWVARSDIATPCSPTAKRAAFIITNMYSRPRFSSPTR